MCSRKNKREVVFAKHRISTASNRCVTLSLGFAKDWFANNSSRYFKALIVIRQTISLR